MNYFVAAYLALWGILLGYLLALWRKQVRLARDLQSLRAQLEQER
jgi:hypothetical protein